MTYARTFWADNTNPSISAANLNKIEAGIEAAHVLAESPSWSNVADKPTSFPSTWADVAGKPATFAPTIGTTATTAKAGNWFPTYAEVTGKPTTFAPIIGTTSTTAKAGDYQPTWTQVTSKPTAFPYDSGGMFVNAATFGLVGNGTTNDAAALQAALDAASSAGTFGAVGRVWIPGGKAYGVGTTLRLPANVVVEGGPSATLLSTNGVTMMCNFTAGDTTTTVYNGRGNITIRNLIFDMRAHQQTLAADCLLFSHARGITVENCVFRNVSTYHHLEFNAVKSARAINCRFEGWKNNSGSSSNDYREAVQIDYAIGSTTPGAQDSTPSEDILVDGCYFGPSADCGAMGRAVGSHTVASGGQPYRSIKVVNNTIEDVIWEGIRAYSWYNSVASGNVIRNATLSAIAVDCAAGVSASNIVVSNNSITTGCTAGAIVVRSMDAGTTTYSNVNLTGNVINAVAGDGISISNSNHPVVVGNKLNSITGTAIKAVAAIGSNISDNAIVTTIDGISVAGGRQHTITGNYLWGATGTASIIVGASATNALVSGNNIYSANTSPTGVQVGAANCTVIGNQLNVAKTNSIDLLAAGTGCTIVGNVASGAAATWVSYAASMTAYMSHGSTAVTPNIAGSNVVR